MIVIIHRSAVPTASGSPKRKHFRSKCTPRGSALISTTPSANRAVNTIPIEESSLVRLNRLTKLTSTAVARPASSAPSRRPMTPELRVSMNAITTPGSTACDRASPINAIRRSTTKHPSTPQATPTSALQTVSCHHRSVKGTSH